MTPNPTLDWSKILACPSCGGSLRQLPEAWSCDPCGKDYPIRDGRPVLRADPSDIVVMAQEHISNQLSTEIRKWIREDGGLTLNIGAGGTVEKLPNCVEFEYAIFRHTDVAGDAHHLPFADGVFDSVVTFNTFEHLADPPRAATEVHRVLRPGGKLVLQTAFLQPLHEPPHHYYNTTEFGLRRWFRDFEITDVRVSENFNPAYVLAWLASALDWAARGELGPEAAEALGKTTLEEWRASWAEPDRRCGTGWEVLRRLSPEIQKAFAAGFQLEAIKPAA